MEYSILIAGVITQLEPTENLVKPVHYVTRYTTDATIITFETESEAIAYASSLWERTNVMVLPGDKKGLELYEQLWMGIGEECLHDLARLSANLLDGVYNWEYSKTDSDSLSEAIEEHEEQQRGDLLEPGETPVVGSYAMDKSDLVLYSTSSVFLLGHECSDVEFEDLTPEEQELVITEDSKGKAIVTVSMGAMFDLWCLKKFNGNVIEAMAYATALAARNDLSMTQYRISERAGAKTRSAIKKINKLRIDKGWL